MKVIKALAEFSAGADVALWREAWIRVKQAERDSTKTRSPRPNAYENSTDRHPTAAKRDLINAQDDQVFRKQENVERAEQDVKDLERELIEIGLSVTSDPFRRLAAKEMLNLARKRLATIDPTSYLLL